MSGYEVKKLLPVELELGEGPHWEESKGCLLFVSITDGELHRLFTETGRHQVLRVEPGDSGKTVSFVIPVEGEDDLYVIGQGRSICLIQWPVSDPDLTSRKVKVTLHTVDNQSPTNRFNDGKCDPQGRLYAGTMGKETAPGVLPPHLGSLFRVDPDLTLTCCVDKVSLSNGLAWSNDHTTFYYIDSPTHKVEAFDYDAKTGAIDKRRTVLDFKQAGLADDIPDGMCVDSNGDLWVACFYGGKVIRINPASQSIKQTVALPATNITSVCFGGDQLATLFVTSSRIGLTPQQLQKESAGGTFAVTGLGVTGVAPADFRLNEDVLKKVLEDGNA